MEHRWNVRMSIRLDVEIYCRGQVHDFAIGRTRDLSGSGVYVEVDSATIPANTYVDVRFVLQDDMKGRSFQVPAIVTHTNTGGVGLMFVDHDPQVTVRLIGLLQCHLGILADRQVQGFVGRHSDAVEQ